MAKSLSIRLFGATLLVPVLPLAGASHSCRVSDADSMSYGLRSFPEKVRKISKQFLLIGAGIQQKKTTPLFLCLSFLRS